MPPSIAAQGSTQMIRFAESLKLYAAGRDDEVKHYPGEHTKALALLLAEVLSPDDETWMWQEAAKARVIRRQRDDLAAFGVTFDTWSYESHVHMNGRQKALRVMCALGQVYWPSSVTGNPLCGNCFRPITPNEPCQWCMGAEMESLLPADVRISVCRVFSHDPALHPDNDWIADE